jgi:hypothetical protein
MCYNNYICTAILEKDREGPALTEIEQKKSLLRRAWDTCPVRHILVLLGIAVIAAYFVLRRNMAIMRRICTGFVQPYHRFMGQICSLTPFSMAELTYVLLGCGVLLYVCLAIRRLIRGVDRGKTAYRLLTPVLSLALVIYGGFCLLWGVYYHDFDFAALSGIQSGPVAREDLEAVTAYFAGQANTYADQVPRTDGLYTAQTEDILSRSRTLYRAVEDDYPFLRGVELTPKPMLFSKFMSWINFTGFFFPFTGEANLNIDAPVCLLPSTAAHEIAHQRGIAAENEANFVAVLTCMAGDDPEFAYSGALLAFIHLGNALYSVDHEAYWAICETLSPAVQADLDDNNAYWARYETRAAEVSEQIYTGFLQSHGQTLGMKSYGACVDLLVAHYVDAARN